MSKTTTKFQFRGHCQCCGRQQAVLSGHMSHHGYEVKWSSFVGSCQGNRFAPMETDILETIRIVALVRKQADEAEAYAASIVDGSHVIKFVSRDDYTAKRDRIGRLPKIEVPFDTLSPQEQAREKAARIHNALNNAKSMRQWAQSMEDLGVRVHGKPLMVVAPAVAPEPIPAGEQRITPRKVVLTAQGGQFEGKVTYRYLDAEGSPRRMKMTTRMWRTLPLVVAA